MSDEESEDIIPELITVMIRSDELQAWVERVVRTIFYRIRGLFHKQRSKEDDAGEDEGD